MNDDRMPVDINGQPRWLCRSCGAHWPRLVPGAVTDPSSRKLSDDDRMPFGKWKGFRLGEVPDYYFRWLLRQDWACEYPRLLEYAQLVEDD